MKNRVQKDQKKRFLYSKNEYDRKLLKVVSYNLNYPKELRWKAQLQLSDLPKRSSKLQIHHRCILTGRARFLVRGFNLSRFMIRKCAQQGLISGLRKACW